MTEQNITAIENYLNKNPQLLERLRVTRRGSSRDGMKPEYKDKACARDISYGDTIQELPKPATLLWSGNKRIKHITQTFTEEEIQSMFKILETSPDYWTKGGYKQWGEFYRQRDITILHCIYYGALRPKEACSLKFLDINFEKKTIFINGQNNKQRKDRVIHLCKQIIPQLQKYLSFNKKFWKNSEYLFPSNQNDYVSANHLKMVMREKVLKPLGLWEDDKFRTRLYSLRKSRASHLLEQTKDLYAVSNILGHADTRITASYYIDADHKYMDYLGKAMDGEIESLKTPEITVNQTNNINIQMNLILQQMQQQNAMMLQMMQKLLEKKEV